MSDGEKLTLAQAAEKLGMDPAELLGFIAAGLLPAEENSDDYLIDPDDLSLVEGL